MRPIHTLLFLASALALAACKQGGEPEAAPAEIFTEAHRARVLED